MTQLSVNINKVATLRNSRGGNLPNVLRVALDCEAFGAKGITVHPRPDGRHILYDDVRAIKKAIKVELNVEGFPSKEFVNLLLEVHPAQVTLVPDAINQLTSNHGWDTIESKTQLVDIVNTFKIAGIRTSIFIEPDPIMAEGAMLCGADRVELFTGHYAKQYKLCRQEAIKPYIETAKMAQKLGLGINAGHDLNLNNLEFFCKSIPCIDEVSIGHALICDALYMGLERTITLYNRCLEL